MKTATVELPTIVVSAINEFSTTGKLIWRIGEGLDHVKIELTYKLPDDQSTGIVGQAKNKPFNVESDRGKKAKRRSKPAPSADEWPRQPLPAEKPPATPAKPTRQQPQRRCKTPKRELPPPPTDPCPETLPPKVAAGRVGAQPPTERDCPPPTTPTMTLPKPILKNANRPPPSPMIVLPPPADEPLTIYRDNNAPLDDEGETILPDVSDLPGTEDDYDFQFFPPEAILNRLFEIDATRHYQGYDYFLIRNLALPPELKYYARHDKETNRMMLACPPGTAWMHYETVYKHFKRIFHQKASPSTANINEFSQLRICTIVAYQPNEDSDSDAD